MTHNWKYEKEFNPEDYFGFIYKITNLKTGKFYIGKKQFVFSQNKKLGKKEIKALPKARGRKPKTKLIKTTSNWENYWGSSKPLLEDIQKLGEDKFKREIIMLCKTKKQLSYWEIHYQITLDCLFRTDTYNDCILGKFYTRDFAEGAE